jgi:hypothetical protein
MKYLNNTYNHPDTKGYDEFEYTDFNKDIFQTPAMTTGELETAFV